MLFDGPLDQWLNRTGRKTRDRWDHRERGLGLCRDMASAISPCCHKVHHFGLALSNLMAPHRTLQCAIRNAQCAIRNPECPACNTVDEWMGIGKCCGRSQFSGIGNVICSSAAAPGSTNGWKAGSGARGGNNKACRAGIEATGRIIPTGPAGVLCSNRSLHLLPDGYNGCLGQPGEVWVDAGLPFDRSVETPLHHSVQGKGKRKKGKKGKGGRRGESSGFGPYRWVL